MKRVGAHSIAHHLGQDARLALGGEFQLFQNQNARALAHHEPVAIPIPRP